MKLEFGLTEAICPVCKKKFFYESTYVYKVYNKYMSKTVHVCSYHCVREYEKAREMARWLKKAEKIKKEA